MSKLKDVELLVSIEGIDVLKEKLSRIQLLLKEAQEEFDSIPELIAKLKL